MKKLGVIIVVGLMRLLALQPLWMHQKWAKLFRWLLLHVLHYRRQVVMVNLARSFPELKYGELKQIEKDFYLHFCDVVTETIWFAGAADHERLHKQEIVRVTNPEVINEVFLHTPGVVMLTSHCGNWELSGGIEHYFYDGAKMAFDEHTYSVVYKRLESDFWDEIMARNRCAAIQDRANCCVESKDILRYAIAHRHEHHIYLFPTDQYPYGYAASAPVGEFMNQPTKTMTGAAALACRMGFCVVYLGMNRTARGRYEMTYTVITRDAGAMTPEAVMRSYYDLLETDIRRDPGNYLWTHKRWK